MKDLKIVFFGTPDFAVASLTALLEAGYNVVGVVTAPDKPAGRGLQLHETAVKKFAVEKGLNVLQPEKLRSPEFLDQLKALNPDLQVIVAFRMLPEMVWNMPPLGTINVHASLLPQYRGAAPINWAIINGEKESGVTTFRLQHEIDTGNILLQEKVPILPEDNAGSLYNKLMEKGAELLVRTINGIKDNSIKEQPQQDSSAIKHAPKIFKETTHINWDHTAEQVHNFIRGLSPYPAAFTSLKDKTLRIYQSHFEKGPAIKAGGFDTDGKTFLRFAASDGWVYAEELQLEGKKKMPVAEFLRGFRA